VVGEDDMAQWEYRTVRLKMDPKTGDIPDAPMADMGADGWELVCAAETVRVGNTQYVYLYFKRPKP